MSELVESVGSTTPPQPVSLLHRWGVAMARHRRPVLIGWAIVLVVCALAYPALESRLTGMDFTVPGSESAHVDQIMAAHFPQFGAEQDVIVFDSPDSTVDSPEFRSTVERTIAAVHQIPGVRGVIDPYSGLGQIAPNNRVAIALVGIDGDMAQRAAIAKDLQQAITATDTGGINAAMTGYSPVQNDVTDIQKSDMTRAEMIGIPVALILLVLALGALVAALVPVAVALAGLLLAAGAMFALTGVTSFDALVSAMATMIGVGVGIDYAMFIVSRFREELAHTGVTGRDQHTAIADAAGRALGTAGKTVLASGVIVMISLCSLIIIDAPVFRGITLGVALAVIATLLVGLTLLPALLAELGPAVNRGALPARWRPAETLGDNRFTTSAWARWARTVMRRPIIFGGVAVAILALAAAPLLGIRYGLDMGTSALADTPSGRANTALTANFPAGALAPVDLVATSVDDGPLTPAQTARVGQYLAEIGRDDRVEAVLPPQLADGRLLAAVVPAVAFDSAEADALVRDLRDTSVGYASADGPVIRVGGPTAEFVDLSEEMNRKLPFVVAGVLAASLVFLLAAFRSIALPVKAILMNLLATGAALGITVAVFQWGIGETVLGFTSTGFLQVYLPTVVFAVLFGLSMDYEVFLIRRMREYWDTTGDNTHAVAAGITHTARPITAAAAIMIAVFGSFITADVLELKQIGFALALAVAIDAILVRLILVPALMRLFGRWNWWLPTRRPVNRI
ncbi:MMPL family transporter [Nocardia sputi]|uniref:MMPL family transporter n=1 Tax=Nocardia sputi TaxID=2943705 RepID=UPI0020C0A777|nr:MMPL family transporter [Nocardia sputi]